MVHEKRNLTSGRKHLPGPCFKVLGFCLCSRRRGRTKSLSSWKFIVFIVYHGSSSYLSAYQGSVWLLDPQGGCLWGNIAPEYLRSPRLRPEGPLRVAYLNIWQPIRESKYMRIWLCTAEWTPSLRLLGAHGWNYRFGKKRPELGLIVQTYGPRCLGCWGTIQACGPSCLGCWGTIQVCGPSCSGCWGTIQACDPTVQAPQVEDLPRI